MRIYAQQFGIQKNRPALRQVWIWPRNGDGAHLEACWIDDSRPAAREAREPQTHEIEACLEALESAA